MRKVRLITGFGAIIAITALIVAACTKDKTPAPIEPCDPNKVYFQKDILPIISSNCAKSGCHDAITRTEGLNLTNYNGVMAIVKAGNANGSEIIKVINATKADDVMPPSPNNPLTAVQKNLINKWISDGALNSICLDDAGSCTTTTVSYGADISKIVTANCVGCHGGGTLSGGVDLSTYTGIRAVALSGKLYNAVSQNGSAVPMPPQLKLSACDIKSIKTWVDSGSPNN